MLLILCLSLTVETFQPAPVQCDRLILNGLASCWSRELGTAFRSLATTLSSPLRGQRSRPAPSLPHRKTSQARSIPSSSTPSGFDAVRGEFHAWNPLPVWISSAPMTSTDPHSPLGLLDPPDQSVQAVPSREARLAQRPITFRSPLRSLSIALRINAPGPPRPAWLSFAGSPERAGIPRAVVLTVSFVFAPETGLCCLRHQRECLTSLTSASGHQAHTTSPSA